MMIMIMMMTLLMTMMTIIGTLRNCDADGKENVNKAIGLMSKTTTARALRFFVHFFAVPAQLRPEMTKVYLRTGTARR